LVRLANVFAALLLASTTAYTAGQLDIEAAQQALQKSKNKRMLSHLRKTWSAITRR